MRLFVKRTAKVSDNLEYFNILSLSGDCFRAGRAGFNCIT